jgi:hypothetical protein
MLHRKIKFYLHTGNLPSAYQRGKIAGPGRRYFFTSGLPTYGIFRLKSKFWDSIEKRQGHFLDQYLDF